MFTLSPLNANILREEPVPPATETAINMLLINNYWRSISMGPGEKLPREGICEAGLEESRSLPGREGFADLRFADLSVKIITCAFNVYSF